MRYYRDTLDILSVRLGPLEQFNKYQGFFFFLILGKLFLYFFIYLRLFPSKYKILVPQPGIEPVTPAVEGQSLNHWTAREVPWENYLLFQSFSVFHL